MPSGDCVQGCSSMQSQTAAIGAVCAHIAAACRLTGFEPLQQSVSAYAGVVLVSVAVEEAARYGVWRMHA